MNFKMFEQINVSKYSQYNTITKAITAKKYKLTVWILLFMIFENIVCNYQNVKSDQIKYKKYKN